MPEVYARSRAIVEQLEAEIVRLPAVGEASPPPLPVSDDLGAWGYEPPD